MSSENRSKDPAFLFYPGDYLRDTQILGEREQVAYDRLMCEHMRTYEIHVSKIGVSQQIVDFVTKRLEPSEKLAIMEILVECDAGFQIPWVAESICKRRLYSESRSKNRSKKPKKTSKTYVPHMEDENENENRSVSIKVSEDFESFWNAYGHKVGRVLAEREFLNEVKGGTKPKEIIRAASEYSAYCTKTGRKKQDAKNWLSEKAYQTDWLEVAKSDSSGTVKSQKAATRQTAFEIINTINDEANDG